MRNELIAAMTDLAPASEPTSVYIQYVNNPVRFGFIQQAFGGMGLAVI